MTRYECACGCRHLASSTLLSLIKKEPRSKVLNGPHSAAPLELVLLLLLVVTRFSSTLQKGGSTKNAMGARTTRLHAESLSLGQHDRIQPVEGGCVVEGLRWSCC